MFSTAETLISASAATLSGVKALWTIDERNDRYGPHTHTHTRARARSSVCLPSFSPPPTTHITAREKRTHYSVATSLAWPVTQYANYGSCVNSHSDRRDLAAKALEGSANLQPGRLPLGQKPSTTRRHGIVDQMNHPENDAWPQENLPHKSAKLRFPRGRLDGNR